jgi:chromosome segregation ATPase
LQTQLEIERLDYFKLNEELKRLRSQFELETEASQARLNQWVEQVAETEKWKNAYNDAVKSAKTISKKLRIVKEELEFAKIELTSCTGEYNKQKNAISIYKEENTSLKDELIVVLEENELLKKTLKSIL